MKTKIIFLLLCFLSLNVMGQGIIRRNKPKTTQTQPTKTKPATKPSQKQSVKMCDICEKPLSKCDYGGKHPYCQTCGKLKERCEYKGNHPSQQSSTTAVTPTQQTKKTTGTLNGHEWVDLGLSVKWATCNVGASSPSDYGGYYAWGETSTKSRYDLDNYFDCLDSSLNSSDDSWETYKLNGQTRITPTSGHDTARENWGGTWRMPTRAEIEELCEKCKWARTSKNGHNGFIAIGPNGNSIFLPAAGYRFGTDSLGIGGCGIYRSSTLSSLSSSHWAYDLYLYENVHSMRNHYLRSYGQSVRPVTE